MSGKRKTSALVFTLAVFAYTLASAILLVHSEQLNGHRFIYPLDDSYIHLSIARNMALHGSFGINAGEYAAATSAPLWTLMLSAVLRIAGIRETSALAMSFCSGLLLLLVCFLLLRRLEAGMTVQILAYGLIVFATPMPLLGLSGMEHLLHAAVVILIVFGAGSVLASEAPPLIGIAPLLALIAAGVLVRFETLFVAAIFAGFLLLGKRWLISFLVAMAAAIPVLLTGAISVSHGWFWMPASILIKSQKAPVTGLSTLLQAGRSRRKCLIRNSAPANSVSRHEFALALSHLARVQDRIRDRLDAGNFTVYFFVPPSIRRNWLADAIRSISGGAGYSGHRGRSE